MQLETIKTIRTDNEIITALNRELQIKYNCSGSGLKMINVEMRHTER